MTTRLDLVLKKYPDHEDGLRLLASRDPSGNLKYLDWAAKMLASGQALAPEIADILDLFHQFNGRAGGRRRERVRSDIYSYRPQDLTGLRDLLRAVKRAQDRKRRKRERLYQIDGTVDVDVVYDSPDLIVRHIKNKNASVHYGLGTKWCIAMRREGYFEDYESQNATFFFVERKAAVGDPYDKVAVMVPRGGAHTVDDVYGAAVFNALDQNVNMFGLARVHGLRVFDIFRSIFETSERYPGSIMAQVYAGRADATALQTAFETVIQGQLNSYEIDSLLEAICCNDAAPWALLDTIVQRGPELSVAARKREQKGGRYHYRRRRRSAYSRKWTTELERVLTAALVIHAQTPDAERDRLTKSLKRRRIRIDNVRRVDRGDRVGVTYDPPVRALGRGRRRHFRRRTQSPKYLRDRAGMFDRIAKRLRRKARTVERERRQKLTRAENKKKLAAGSRRKKRR